MISFTGHLALLIIMGIITTFHRQSRETIRPSVITVQILPRGTTPQTSSEPKTQLIPSTPKPVPVKKEPEKPSPQPKKNDANALRYAGLGAKVEGPNILGYNYYLQQMMERIAQNWQDPYYGRNLSAKATIMFKIQRDGQIAEVKVERSSNDPLFDESCLRSVIVTGKLPPLPEEFTAPQLKIHLEFER